MNTQSARKASVQKQKAKTKSKKADRQGAATRGGPRQPTSLFNVKSDDNAAGATIKQIPARRLHQLTIYICGRAPKKK